VAARSAPPQPEPQAPDLRAVEQLRSDAASARRTVLTESETNTLLSTFSLPVAPAVLAGTLAEAIAAARRLRYPVTLRSAARSPRRSTSQTRRFACAIAGC
jgi:acyl-CoA synthetase (NDP forming)